MTNYSDSIGDKLRLLRFERNITQQKVSLETGLKVTTISKIENNKGDVRNSSIKKLANYYGVIIEELEN